MEIKEVKKEYRELMEDVYWNWDGGNFLEIIKVGEKLISVLLKKCDKEKKYEKN